MRLFLTGASAAATAAEAAWRIGRLPGAPPITRHAVMVMSRDCTLIDMKARRELGYRPLVSVEEGLERMQFDA